MFIPRHPVVENQFCKYASQTGTGSDGVGGVIAYAGSVLYLKNDATNEESEVLRYNLRSEYLTFINDKLSQQTPFGFSMQKVKTGYHQVHPTGFMLPGDLGSSDVIAQALYDGATGAITGTKEVPVGVAHNGIWDTCHYTVEGTDAVLPGDFLYVAANSQGRITNSSTESENDDDSGQRMANAAHTSVTVARVLRGVSSAKAAANKANTVLYPIRIKLMI